MRSILNRSFLTAAVLCTAAGSASAEDIEFPSRQSGMWEIVMVQDQAGAPTITVKACVDETSDKQMMAAGISMSKSMCPEQSMVKDGDNIVIDSVCNIGGMTSKSHTVMSGDFQSSYRVEVTSDITGGMPGMAGPGKMTQTATWKGPDCSDGLKPGDMLMPGGMKVNITDMMKSMGGG